MNEAQPSAAHLHDPLARSYSTPAAMKRGCVTLFCLILLAFSLWLRLSGLDRFLTPDENLWATRTTQFVTALNTRDWAATNVSGHPGVTTMWAGSLGLTAKWLLARPPDVSSFADSVSALAADPVRLDYLPWMRMPIALICAGAIIVIYLLVRRLMGEGVALLAAGLLSFDSFLLAHTRVLQLDGLLTLWITIAWLALLVALGAGQRRFFVVSGLSIGAALLTKSPALVMGPLMLGAIMLARLRPGGVTRAACGRILLDLLWIGVPALAVVFTLWPALWVRPVETLGRVWGLMIAYGGGEHELGNYWLGTPTPAPGILFYPAILALRTTPVTSVGLLLSLVWAVPRRNAAASGRHSAWALWVFVLWFVIVQSFGAKKFDRYLLPVFPALDVLAAWGWAATLGWAAARLQSRRGGGDRSPPPAAFWAGVVILVSAQIWGALSNRPSFLTSYNPLAGGISAAARTVLVGWGEGLAEAADFLNDRPDAEGSRTAAWYGKNVFGAFYQGESYDLTYDTPKAADLYTHDVDWVVTYINQEQRGLVDPSVATQLGTPQYTVARDGVTLASVYAWPKPFAHTSDRPISQGLRLLGWEVGDHDRREGALPVTFYWDATELAAVHGQRVVTWMKDAAGEVWATAEETIETDSQESPPSLQATDWPGRPVVAQSFTLRPPIGLSPGSYRIEIAPFAGQSTELAALEIEATRLSEAASLDPQTVIPSGEVRFGDVARLVGSSLDTTGESWTVDLVWEWLASPGEPHHYFIHVVDAAGQMIAQRDGPLAVPGSSGELARQRINLALPKSAAGTPARVYVGIYQPQDGVRVPLVASGQPVPDGRYLLATLP